MHHFPYACVVSLAVTSLAVTSLAAQRTTDRISLTAAGVECNGAASALAITPDGRFVAFLSEASDLVPGDTNGRRDVFVRDRATGGVERVSVGAGGVQGNGHAGFVPSISADGRFVAFQSAASNLVPGDTNGVADVFVRDRVAGATERVSIASGGAQGDLAAHSCAISADGGRVAFQSAATNLVPGDSNGRYDVFVRDRVTGTTERVSVATGGAQGDGHSTNPAISGDGRVVAFDSRAANLVAADDNNQSDVFVHELATGRTTLVSVGRSGSAANGSSAAPSLSADGTRVAFESSADDLVVLDDNWQIDVFVADLAQRGMFRLSVAAGAEGNGTSYWASISADGRWVAFVTGASNLVAGDSNGVEDVLVAEVSTFVLQRASVATSGAQADGRSFAPAIGNGGGVTVFASDATNLVPGDRNARADAFAHVVAPRASYTPAGSGCAGSLGTPRLEASIGHSPMVGSPFELALTDLPLGGVVFLCTTGARMAQPVELSWLRMPGCWLHVVPAVITVVPVRFPLELVPFPIPGDPALAGATFAQQVVVRDPAANAMGLVLTNAADGVVGW